MLANKVCGLREHKVGKARWRAETTPPSRPPPSSRGGQGGGGQGSQELAGLGASQEDGEGGAPVYPGGLC